MIVSGAGPKLGVIDSARHSTRLTRIFASNPPQHAPNTLSSTLHPTISAMQHGMRFSVSHIRRHEVLLTREKEAGQVSSHTHTRLFSLLLVPSRLPAYHALLADVRLADPIRLYSKSLPRRARDVLDVVGAVGIAGRDAGFEPLLRLPSAAAVYVHIRLLVVHLCEY